MPSVNLSFRLDHLGLTVASAYLQHRKKRLLLLATDNIEFGVLLLTAGQDVPPKKQLNDIKDCCKTNKTSKPTLTKKKEKEQNELFIDFLK